MKQKKQADKSAKSKPKLVKKPNENVYKFTDEAIEDFLVDIPNGVTRRIYWNMAMSNLKKWLKTFF